MRAISVAKATGIAVTLCIVMHEGLAQSYPSRLICLVAHSPRGGGADVVARALSQHLFEILGHPVVVDNRAGAGATSARASSPRRCPLVVPHWLVRTM